MIVPCTLISTGSDDRANPPTVALHEYEPLFDCCIGLNCSWLVVEASLSVIVMEPPLTTGVLPSGGPSHWKIPSEPPAEHSKVYISPAMGGSDEVLVIDTPPKEDSIFYPTLTL